MIKKIYKNYSTSNEKHSFYLIKYSPWPFYISVTLLLILLFTVFHIFHLSWYNNFLASSWHILPKPIYSTLKFFYNFFFSVPYAIIDTNFWNIPTILGFRFVDDIYPTEHPFDAAVKLWKYSYGYSVELVLNNFLWLTFHTKILYFLSFLIFGMSIIGWTKDLIIESVYMGYHTNAVKKNLAQGFMLFILSETMFFIGFFWGYFHFSLAPAALIGLQWPPEGIKPINPSGLAFINTVLLLYSSVTLHYAYKLFFTKNPAKTFHFLFITIILGIIFLICQIIEYINLHFSINSSVYGSIFFLLTGCHGLHVFVGLILLIISSFRLLKAHFSKSSHLGFKVAIWYWHFVDIIWIFVYLIIYWWTFLRSY